MEGIKKEATVDSLTFYLDENDVYEELAFKQIKEESSESHAENEVSVVTGLDEAVIDGSNQDSTSKEDIYEEIAFKQIKEELFASHAGNEVNVITGLDEAVIDGCSNQDSPVIQVVVKQPSRLQQLGKMSGEASVFVQKIERYLCLYDYLCAEYSRKDITEKAWSEVAQEMNWKVADCKDKWRNIRNGFVRSLRGKLPSGSGAKAKKPYYLHDELQFLMPYIRPIAHSEASSNVTPDSDQTQEEKETELNENESQEPSNTDDNVNPQATSSSQASLNSMASKSKKHCKKRRAAADPVDKSLMEYLRKKKENLDRPNPEEDARKMFLLSMLPDVNQLSDIGFRQFKMKAMMIIEELLASGQFNRSATPYPNSNLSLIAPLSHPCPYEFR